MAWQAAVSSYVLTSGQRIRISVAGGYVEVGPTEAKIRQFFEEYTDMAISSVSHVLFWGWYVEGTAPGGGTTVGELRGQAEIAVNAMRDEWLVVAPGMAIYDIEIEKTSLIPDIPTTTAVSLAAIAILVIVGYLLLRTYVPK